MESVGGSATSMSFSAAVDVLAAPTVVDAAPKNDMLKTSAWCGGDTKESQVACGPCPLRPLLIYLAQPEAARPASTQTTPPLPQPSSAPLRPRHPSAHWPCVLGRVLPSPRTRRGPRLPLWFLSPDTRPHHPGLSPLRRSQAHIAGCRP